MKTARKSKGNVQKSAGKMHENVMVGIVRHVMARAHSAGMMVVAAIPLG